MKIFNQRDMKKYIYIILAICIQLPLSAQKLEQGWSVNEGGQGFDMARALTTDSDGNIYSTGNFQGEATFRESVVKASGDSDIFIAKYNEGGGLEWIRTAGSNIFVKNAISEYGTAVTATDEHVYAVGTFSREASFGDLKITSIGKQDIFIAKYDKDGELVWVKSAGGKSQDRVTDITHDDDGNIYITGYYQNSAFFGNIGLENGRFTNLFVAKYDAMGNAVWVKEHTQEGNAQGSSLKYFDNSLYLAGNFESGLGNEEFEIVGEGGTDVFISQYDLDGQNLWTSSFGGSQLETVADLDVNELGVFIVGSFEGSIQTQVSELSSVGKSDAFIAKYNLLGQPIWFKGLGGPDMDLASAIRVTDNKTVLVAGNFKDNILDGEHSIYAMGNSDVFVTELSSTGELLQLSRQGQNNQDLVYSISKDLGSLILSGAIGKLNSGNMTTQESTNVFVNKVNLPFTENSETLPFVDFAVYPNPTNDLFEVNLVLNDAFENIDIGIYNLSGMRVAGRAFTQTNRVSHQFDIGDFASGLYLVTVKADDKEISKNILLK